MSSSFQELAFCAVVLMMRVLTLLKSMLKCSFWLWISLENSFYGYVTISKSGHYAGHKFCSFWSFEEDLLLEVVNASIKHG